MAQKIAWYQGEDVLLRVTVTDPDGAAVDVTGMSFVFRVKKKPTSAHALITKTTPLGIVLTDPEAGVVELTIAASESYLDSGNYYWAFARSDSGSREVEQEGGVSVLASAAFDDA